MLYDNSRYLVLCVIVLLVSGYGSLFLRIFTRLKRNAWGWDDSVAVLSAIPFAWLCAETIVAANNGLGARSEHITPAMETQAYKAFVLFQVAYCTSIVLIKLSIALTFVRIMTDQVIILWILRITVGLFTLVTTAVAIYCMFQCRPIAKSWDPTIEGYCQPANILASLSMTVTVCSIVSDLIVSALPIPLLWNVKINRYSKIAAGFLLSLGLFACICAIVRLSYTLALNATEEYLFQVYGVTVWCFAEVGVALTVGCLSTLRPLCASCLGGSMKSTGRSTSFRSGDRYELRSKNGVIHSSVQHGQVQSGATAVSDGGASFTDNESNRSILGPADIRVIKQYHVDSRSAV